jgi:hypothetical protein
MRVVSLSDHPAAMLRDAQRRRLAAERDAGLAYQDVLAGHGERVARARATRDGARAQHRWGAWLRGVFAVRRLRRETPPIAAPARGPTDEEAKLAAGMEGERLVETALAAVLDDEWVLLRGYRNRGGEIDHLLIGPRGVFAIEGKHRNATIDCDGDRWVATKYDRYGNQVEDPVPMTDRRGRSPSEQVNEPASVLQDFLHRRGHSVTITRIVALTHPRARIGNCTGLTVHITTSIRQVTDLLNSSPAALTPAQRADLEQLITRDHRSRSRRRSP